VFAEASEVHAACQNSLDCGDKINWHGGEKIDMQYFTMSECASTVALIQKFNAT